MYTLKIEIPYIIAEKGDIAYMASHMCAVLDHIIILDNDIEQSGAAIFSIKGNDKQ